jgi:hypothetical protein
MTDRIGIGRSASFGMAAAIAAASMFGMAHDLPRRQEVRKHKRQSRSRKKADRSRKQYLLKGIRP